MTNEVTIRLQILWDAVEIIERIRPRLPVPSAELLRALAERWAAEDAAAGRRILTFDRGERQAA